MYSDDIDDMDELGLSAPQPIDEAVLAQVDLGVVNAASAPKPAQRVEQEKATPQDRRAFVTALAGALAVVVIFGLVMARLFGQATAGGAAESEPEQQVVAANETITYRGRTYGLVETEAGHALAELHDGADPTQLGDIGGSPAALILYKAALFVPENLVDGTWDIQVYTIGAGWSPLVDEEGNPRGGEGVVSAAAFDGDDPTLLHLTVGESTVDVNLPS